MTLRSIDKKGSFLPSLSDDDDAKSKLSFVIVTKRDFESSSFIFSSCPMTFFCLTFGTKWHQPFPYRRLTLFLLSAETKEPRIGRRGHGGRDGRRRGRDIAQGRVEVEAVYHQTPYQTLAHFGASRARYGHIRETVKKKRFTFLLAICDRNIPLALAFFLDLA